MSNPVELSSIHLSQIVELLIGTEDAIKSMRMGVNKLTLSNKWVARYTIGSQCDCLNLKGSDIDNMIVHKQLPVIDTLSGDGTVAMLRSNYLLACWSPSSSAYVCIEMHINETLNSRKHVTDALWHSVIYYRDSLLVSSSLFLQHNSLVVGGDVVGPSHMNAVPIDIDNDNVHAFHCKTFPLVADEWIHRKRKYHWPSPRLIQLSEKLGYHLVPIGDYNTTMLQFQWRISFVLQECLLVRTFNHLQMQVYALLKMIKSEVLSAYKSQHTGTSLITSYHIKTLMFWTVECIPKYIWCSKNLLLCIQICLMFLKHFVKSNFMPHYFIPNCNLFKKHVSTDLSSFVIDLSKYAKNPLSAIVMVNEVMDIVPTFLACNNDILKVIHTYTKLVEYAKLTIADWNNPIYPMRVMQTLLPTVHGMTELEWYLTYGLLLSSMLNNEQRIKPQPFDGVKSLYKHYRKVKQISLLYTHLDISTGWLVLSSYLYQTHDYERCREIANGKVILPIIVFPQVIYCGQIRNIEELVHTLTYECSRTSISHLLKHLACCPIGLHMNLLPRELDIETNLFSEDGINSVYFLSLQYAYFLSFLCSYHLHDVRLQFTYLHHLQSMANDEHFGFIVGKKGPWQIILNMVGICFELMGDVSNAAHYYRLSAANGGMMPWLNKAANIRLRLLMMQNNIYH